MRGRLTYISTKSFAGAVGAHPEVARCAVRRALGAACAGELAAAQAVLAWTGAAQPASPRVAVVAGSARSVGADPAQALGDALDGDVSGLSLLRGRFAVAALDGDTGRGVLASDQLGAGGLFVHSSAGCLWFASELDVLMRLIPATPPPSRPAVAQWLADGYLEAGETLYENVSRVRGGHLVRIKAVSDAAIERYWKPIYIAPAALGLEESSSALRGALERAVGSRLPAAGPAGVLLSGGLDSSTVAAIATTRKPAHAVRGLTLAYPDHPEADESALVDDVARSLKIEVIRLEMRGADALAVSLDLQAASGVPASTPMSAFTFPLLRLAEREGLEVVLDGEGGDELFGCSPFLLADRLRRGRLLGAAELARALPQNVYGAGSARALGEHGVKGLLPHRAHRLARAVRGGHYGPAWLAPASRRLYVETRDEWSWKRLAGPRWWAYQAHLLTTWREQLGVHDYLRLRDTLVGIDGGHPLLDDLDLIELVLRLPPEHAFLRTATRPVARKAVRGLIPDTVRLRRAKADFSRLLVESVGRVGLPLARELLAPGAEIAEHVQAGYLARVLSIPENRRNVSWARLVWRLATTEAWLRTQMDPAAIGPLLEAHAARAGTSAARGG